MTLRHLQPAAIAAALLASLSFGHATLITKDYGTGSDLTHLYIQFAGSTDAVLYNYHFTYNPSTPLTGAALFIALDDADTSLSLDYGGTAASGFFLNSITYGTYTEPTYSEVGTFYWTSFLSGGKVQAYDGSYSPIPGQFDTVASGSWSFGTAGASDRLVEPGSWDGWVFGEYDSTDYTYIGAMPSISPVPEPGALGLLAIGGAALFFLRRNPCASEPA